MQKANHLNVIVRLIITPIFLLQSGLLLAQQEVADPVRLMTADKLEQIVNRLDDRYYRDGNTLYFNFGDKNIRLFVDPRADRMRVVIPVAQANTLDKDKLIRLMQANFDSALDARYALAQGVLWSTFLHPLGSLSEDDFIMGVGQAINIVTSYGDTFSSGIYTFGGGDSRAIIEKELLEKIMLLGRAI